jgi:hypothetical protein
MFAVSFAPMSVPLKNEQHGYDLKSCKNTQHDLLFVFPQTAATLRVSYRKG